MNNLTLHRQFTTHKNDMTIATGDGKSIKEFLDFLKIPESSYDYLHVYVGDIYVEKGMYKHVRPKSSTPVKVIMLPEGGDNQIFATIAMIAIAVAAPYAAPAAWQGWAAASLTIGINIAGALLINAIFPPPEAPEMGNEAEGSPALTIAGSRNSFPYDKPVGRIYGTVKYFPPHAAQPYTVAEGGNQYLYMIFDFGHSPIEISELKFGDTLITEYVEVETNFIEEVESSIDLRWFTGDIDTETVNISLLDADDPNHEIVSRTTSDELKYAQFDLVFGGGLYGLNSEANAVNETVSFEVTVYDDSDILISDANIDVTSTFYANLPYILVNTSSTDFNITSKSKDGFSITFDVRVVNIPVPDFIRIEVKRTTTTENGTQTIDGCTYTSLRTFRLGYSINPFRLIDSTGPVYVKHSMLEMRLKATDQLSGVVDNFSCIASAKLRIWDGNAFTAPIVTDNPAWIYADVLTGTMNQRPKEDSRINWNELKRWADFCDTLAEGQNSISTKAHTCNFVLDYSTTLYKLLSEITAVGRASPDVYDDMYSVIFDEEKFTKVQLFTNMNTMDFSSSRIYTEIPDAVRISFRDPLSDWQIRELIVYNDGKDINNSKIFEDIKAPMLTSSNEAYRNGRYWIKQAALRKESITFKTDLEWLECKRGSFVGFQHDVIKTGGTVCRIVSVTGTVVGLDTDPSMNGNEVTQYELRQSDGTIASGYVAFFSVADPYTVDLDISPLLLNVGDMVVFNSAGKSTYDLLIKSIDVNQDQTANITCVEYVPALYDLASEPVPTYTPSISNIGSPTNTPSKLESISISETLTFLNKIAYVTITLNYLPAQGIPPYSYRVYKYNTATSSLDFIGSTNRTSYVWGDSILATDYSIIGQNQCFTVVGVSETGEFMNPALGAEACIIPLGDTTIPEPPDYFVVEDTAENLRRFWWRYDLTEKAEDLKGFIIRYTRSTLDDWSSATTLHDGILLEPPFEIRALPTGTQQVIIRAIDTSNNLSATSSKITFNMGDRPTQNVLFKKDFVNPSAWQGDLVSGSVDATQLTLDILSADLSTSDLMWNVSDIVLMWGDNSKLMWFSTQGSFLWAEEVVVPVGGITTLNWEGQGEVVLSYAKGSYPTAFIAPYYLNATEPTVNSETFDLQDPTFNSSVTITPNYAVSRIGTNDAFRLQDVGSGLQNIYEVYAVSAGDYSWSFDIEKSAPSTTYPFINFNFSGGLFNNFYINLDTGDTQTFSQSGVTTRNIIDNGDYWTVNVTATVTTQTSVACAIYPAYASTATWPSSLVVDSSLTGSVTVWSWGVVTSATPWEAIIGDGTLRYDYDRIGADQGIIPYTSPINLSSGTYTLLISSAISIDVNTLTSLIWYTDVPDINEYFEDISTGTGGDATGVLTITLTKPFSEVTNVSITVQASGTGERAELISKSNTTVVINTYDNLNALADSLLDVRIQGY